jgi:putative transposase
VWLSLRFTLNLRDVEERLAQRGIDMSGATIRAATANIGLKIAAKPCRGKSPTSPHRRLEAMVCTIRGEQM